MDARPRSPSVLVTRCREGKYVDAITELYAPDVRQFENGFEVPGGRDASVAACRGWVTSRVIHRNTILGKHVTDDAVILEMEYDVTPHDTKTAAAVARSRRLPRRRRQDHRGPLLLQASGRLA